MLGFGRGNREARREERREAREERREERREAREERREERREARADRREAGDGPGVGAAAGGQGWQKYYLKYAHPIGRMFADKYVLGK